MKATAIPNDIKPLVYRLKSVKRFQSSSYPKQLFNDDVFSHTVRCVELVSVIVPLYHEPAFPISKALVERILWVHDLVEIGLAEDIPAPDKSINNDLERLAEVQEMAQARLLLKPADFSLWQQFETAKKILTGEGRGKEVLLEAMIARIIDVLDGNIMFNQTLVNHLRSGKTIIQIPAHALRYAFETNRKYYHEVTQSNAWKNLSVILEEELTYIRQLWRQIPEKKIPQALKPHLIH